MKKLFCILTVILLVLSAVIPASAGILNNTFRIKNKDELKSFLNGDLAEKYDTFLLCDDITLEEDTEPTDFSGVFDGNGFTITFGNDCGCLFSKVCKDAVVRNLALDGEIGYKNDEAVNGICYENDGTIENCIITATYKGTAEINGICSVNNGSIFNLAVLARAKLNSSESDKWHPIVSENNGKIDNTYYVKEYFDGNSDLGISIDFNDCKNGKLANLLNAYTTDNDSLAKWDEESSDFPKLMHLEVNDSAMSQSTTVWIICISAFVVLLVLGIIFSDKKLKKAKEQN